MSRKARPGRAMLSLGALGIVFGDVGTSPLYALRETVQAAGGAADPAAVVGAVSLILWALILSITVIYVNVILRVDNEGEGGVLSLAALLRLHRRVKRRLPGGARRALLLLALGGAAMLFGDAVITPAISVLSAVEGLNVALPALDHLIAPIAVTILVVFFAIQVFGTTRIGGFFGPVMLAWFASLGALGLHGIVARPDILAALDPRHALATLAHAPGGAIPVLAALFLAITGGEALYADLGQFGRRAIATAWYAVALPGLALNYLGQGALLLAQPQAGGDPFYSLAPELIRLPLIVLATAATIIASQAVVTGIFGIVRQAGQLGFLPPVATRQTSDENASHVFIGTVNGIVGTLSVAVAWSFGSSEALTDAYGLAVAVAMLATSTLFVATLRLGFRWSWVRLLPLAIPVVGLDAMFVTANAGKFAGGGWLPALLGVSALAISLLWIRGLGRISRSVPSEPLGQFAHRVAERRALVARTAVFLAAPDRDTPTALEVLDRLLHVSFASLVVVTIHIRSRPFVPGAERTKLTRIDRRTVRIDVSTGYMQTTNLPSLLGPAFHDLGVRSDDVIYVSGRDRIRATRRPGRPWAALLDRLFVRLAVNAQRSVDRFGLPPRRTLELGTVRDLE